MCLPSVRVSIRRSDRARNGDRSRYVAGSSQTHSPVWIRLAPAPGPVEGSKLGCGGGHEQHTSSVPGLHGGRLPVTGTGVHVPQVWVWQGTSSQVEKWLRPECGGQRDGESGHCWGVLTSESVFSGAGITAYGRRCGEKSWAYRKGR